MGACESERLAVWPKEFGQFLLQEISVTVATSLNNSSPYQNVLGHSFQPTDRSSCF
jgi:hypothetical protein